MKRDDGAHFTLSDRSDYHAAATMRCLAFLSLPVLGVIAATSGMACGKGNAATKSEPDPGASAPSSTVAAPSIDASGSATLSIVDACTPLHPELPELPTMGDDAPIPPLEGGEALASLYERLAHVLRGTAKDHVRIAVYGDSNGTMDFMTGEMRRVLQTKYGDAGHGFVATGRPWNWYRHRYVRHDSMKDTWEPFTVTTKPVMDGFYGHALIVGESLQAGADTWVQTAEEGSPIGTRASRFDIHFLKWWRGGPFDVKVDGHLHSTIDTEAKKSEAGFARIDVPDGPHKIDIVAKTYKKVRIFGIAVERELAKPSIQVDGLGVGSLNCLTMLRDDAATNKATLQRRHYDLVVFHIGSNTFVAGDLATCMKQVILRHREALPDVPVLIMTPPDFLEQFRPPKTATWMVKVCESMRTMAKDNHAAFFDFRAAMGGDGSMGKFQDAGMTQGDYVHFNEKGGAYMGDRVVYALWKDFAAWLAKKPRAGCE